MTKLVQQVAEFVGDIVIDEKHHAPGSQTKAPQTECDCVLSLRVDEWGAGLRNRHRPS